MPAATPGRIGIRGPDYSLPSGHLLDAHGAPSTHRQGGPRHQSMAKGLARSARGGAGSGLVRPHPKALRNDVFVVAFAPPSRHSA